MKWGDKLKATQIKEEREKKKISRESLAEQLGVSARTIASWERGERQPNSINRTKIKKILKITVSWFHKPRKVVKKWVH